MRTALELSCLIRHEQSTFSPELIDKIRDHNDRLLLTIQHEAIAACRAAVKAKLINGALSLKGLTAMEQADAILAAIDAVEVRWCAALW